MPMVCRRFGSATSNGAEVDAHVAFGQVVGVHIDDRFIKRGLVDTAAMRPIARAGYQDYFVAAQDTRFSLRRPEAGGAADRDAILIVGEQASQDRAQ
jgi:hypothetical protein